MNSLVRKEVRQLLPAFSAAMLIALLPLMLFGIEPWDFTAFTCYGFAALILGIASFGHEIGAGTFGFFLAQPLSRGKLWSTKTRVLACALTLTLLIPCALCWLQNYQHWFGSPRLALKIAEFGVTTAVIWVIALTGLASGLWTTLLFRQVAAAFWIALLTPIALTMPVAWIVDRWAGHEAWVVVAVVVELGLYATVGLWLAKRLFMRAQDVQWTGGTLSLTFDHGLSLAPISWLPRGPWRSLIQKEIQFQQTTLFVTIILLAFHVSAIVTRKYIPASPGNSIYNCLGMIWGLWMIVPIVIGSAAIAEERNMNTLAGCLCLPVKHRVQYFIKLGVVLVTGIIFGAFVPVILEWLGEKWGVRSEMPTGSPLDRVEILALVSIGVSALCFYASTLTRNFLQAMGASVVMVAIGVAIQNIYAFWWREFAMYSRPFLFVGLSITLCVLIYRNTRRLYADFGLWRTNLLSLLAVTAAMSALATGVHWRAWELMMSLEPTHGAPQLKGPVRPKLCRAYGVAVLALLPDGRLWEAQKYNTRMEQESTHTTNGNTLVTFCVPEAPISGSFIGSSNWIDVVNTHDGILALRADGTLWNIESPMESYRAFVHTHRVFGPTPASFLNQSPIYVIDPPKMHQIGTDSDWKTITSGNGFYLAVKNNGMLWGAGCNNSAVLGAQLTNGLERIGTESNWINVFADASESVSGVKRDGSVWRWGRLNGQFQSWTKYTEPARCSLTGTNWASIVDEWGLLLGLEQDGTMWASGHVPEKVLGYRLANSSQTRAGAVRVGGESEWKQISGNSLENMITIHRSGKLEIFDWNPLHHRSSQNSDWIALEDHANWGSIIALAADGTLSSWERQSAGMFASMPSRKPSWNFNILQ